MRIRCLILSLLLCRFISYSQKVQILHQSGFTHDYVVSPLQFIEDPADTTRLKYIAVLSFSGEQNHLLTVAAWFDLIKIRAKSLGANAYLIEKYSENESSVELILKFYFAGLNVIKTNEKKQLTNSVIIFNQTRYEPDTASFYLNDQKVVFNPVKFYSIPTELQKIYYISTNNSNITATKIVFKKPKPSRFYIIPANKYTFVTNRNLLDPLAVGLIINGVAINFGRNAAYALDYQLGRLLRAVYN